MKMVDIRKKKQIKRKLMTKKPHSAKTLISVCFRKGWWDRKLSQKETRWESVYWPPQQLYTHILVYHGQMNQKDTNR